MAPEIHTKPVKSLMSDRHAKQILMDTFFRAKSTQELSEKFGIPFNVCSEKIQALERLGMLTQDNTIGIPRDRTLEYYRSDQGNAHVVYRPNHTYMRFEVMPKLSQTHPRWLTVKLY